MKGSQAKRYLKIDGEDVFVQDIKFDLSLPIPPIPYQKSLYYPLDIERYTKPKLTSFFMKKVGSVLAPCNLNIHPLEILTHTEKSVVNIQKDERKLSLKKSLLERLSKLNGKSNFLSLIPGEEDEYEEIITEEVESIPLKKEVSIDPKEIVNKSKPLGQRVEDGFEKVQEYTVSMPHPTKKNVVLNSIYTVFPDNPKHKKELTYLQEKEIKPFLANNSV